MRPLTKTATLLLLSLCGCGFLFNNRLAPKECGRDAPEGSCDGNILVLCDPDLSTFEIFIDCEDLACNELLASCGECGDGRVSLGEECDEDLRDAGPCLINCTEARCGDGFVLDTDGDGIVDIEDEACDDGNNLEGDGCDAQCQPE